MKTNSCIKTLIIALCSVGITVQADVLDMSNPTQPRRVGGNTAVGGIPGYDGAANLTIAGGKVYALAGGRGLFILNLYEALRLEPMPSQEALSFRVRLRGPPGMTGQIQRSSDFQSWESWMPFNLGDVPLEITDPSARSNATRFYRAVSP